MSPPLSARPARLRGVPPGTAGLRWARDLSPGAGGGKGARWVGERAPSWGVPSARARAGGRRNWGPRGLGQKQRPPGRAAGNSVFQWLLLGLLDAGRDRSGGLRPGLRSREGGSGSRKGG